MEAKETPPQSDLKYWTEKLLIPIVILFVGYMINSTLEIQKEEIDKMKFTEQVIKDVFESKNITKGMALYNILPALLNEKKYIPFVTQTQNSIQAYYTSIALDSIKIGSNPNTILQASNTMTGSSSVMSNQIKKAIKTAADTAKKYEQKGVDALSKNDFQTAHENFQAAATTYPTYHSVSEIATVLNTKITELKRKPVDSDKIKKETKAIIKEKYSWKLPEAKK